MTFFTLLMMMQDLLDDLSANEFAFIPQLSSFLKCELYGLHVTPEKRLAVKFASNNAFQKEFLKNFEDNLDNEYDLHPGDFVLLSHGAYPSCVSL